MKWEKEFLYDCPSCKYSIPCIDESLFLSHVELCPKCGKDIDHGYGINTNYAYCKVRRWDESLVKWWNPYSWGRGFWEYKQKQEAQSETEL